jgi:serine-type D-Ala-D-Ala endopeptidase (penicillin-binding protein 7)
MTIKYSKATLLIVLFVGMLMYPLHTGFSKSSKNYSSHQKYLTSEAGQFPRDLNLRSASALVKDQQTGECLVLKEAQAVLPIASISKLMTAMVVLDADMNLDESLTIEKDDIDRIRHSHSRLSVGTDLTRKEALLLALMASDNRCAHALGRTYPGGIKACVGAMNAKARLLGLTETRFEDTSGLSCSNVSSAQDLARLLEAAYEYSLIRDFTTSKKATIYKGRRAMEFHNTNTLVKNPQWQIGLSKTGFIDEAGRCLVMQANVAQRPVFIVLLDSQGKQTRIGDANRIKRWLEKQAPSQRTKSG